MILISDLCFGYKKENGYFKKILQVEPEFTYLYDDKKINLEQLIKENKTEEDVFKIYDCGYEKFEYK